MTRICTDWIEYVQIMYSQNRICTDYVPTHNIICTDCVLTQNGICTDCPPQHADIISHDRTTKDTSEL